MRTEKTDKSDSEIQAIAQAESIVEMVAALVVTEEDGDSDAAVREIQESPLSVQVRSGWVSIGEAMEAEAFEILLCTGGPAVRILGELQDGEPVRAWIEHQDWGTPWTQAFNLPIEPKILLRYCREFCFE